MINVRRRRISRIADDLLKKHDIIAAPVDVEALANAEGIAILKGELDDEVSGFLRRQGSRVVIGVNKKHADVRQRFTIGHELGHFLLHDVQPLYVDAATSTIRFRNASSSTGAEVDEREANLFAAEVLMPGEFLARDLKGRSTADTEALISEFAKKYRVSNEAMLYRLMYLGFIDPQ